MTRRQLVALVALAFSSVAPTAYGELLFTRSLAINRSAQIFKSEEFNLKIDLSTALTAPATQTLFGDVMITPASVGQKFSLQPGDAGFAAAAQQLTDQINQAVKFVMTERSSGRAEGRGYTQSNLFSRPTAAPDFAGKIIDRVELSINHFTLVLPPPDGAQPVVAGFPVDLNFTLNVFGRAVPEPTTAALSAALLAGWAATRRRRRRSGRQD